MIKHPNKYKRKVFYIRERYCDIIYSFFKPFVIGIGIKEPIKWYTQYWMLPEAVTLVITLSFEEGIYVKHESRRRYIK